MRFLQLKKDKFCYDCGSSIFAGEEAVVIRIRHANGIVIPQFFHTDICYEKWNCESYVNRLLAWRQGVVPLKKKPRLGRPRKYKNILKADKISGLLRYYRRKGNLDKVQELEQELSNLSIKEG